MKIVIVYVYPLNVSADCDNYAVRFIESYFQNPPAMQHETVVMLNNGKLTSEIQCMFAPFPNLRFIEHDNSGYDIGAFQRAAREVPAELMVFFGVSTYFRGQGWLLRMATSFMKHGNAQYGTMGNRGAIHLKVWPHIRTTAFWLKPELLNAYPKVIVQPQDRHPFEHGPECFTSWVQSKGLKSWVITWKNDLLWKDWDSDPNGFHRGDQSNLLVGDHLSEPPYYKNK